MRLDHLLSKETAEEQGKEKRSKLHCLILKVHKRNFKREEAAILETRKDGGVAQLGEHLPCTQGVRSSILLISTTRQGLEENGDKDWRDGCRQV